MKRTREGKPKLEDNGDGVAAEIGQDKQEGAQLKKKQKQDLAPEEVLSRLILRRIIKENHASPIKQIAFNFTKPCNYNLVATVGGNQVRIFRFTKLPPNTKLGCSGERL